MGLSTEINGKKWASTINVLILECIITVSYSILVNGEPKGHIIPTRGIKQGDSLSS